MSDATELLATNEPWHEFGGPVFICGPGARGAQVPDECDCGYVGDWQYRFLHSWHEQPGHRRGDNQIRRDVARGLPARSGDEGWWVFNGETEERCPGCGDIERFDTDHNLIEAEINEVGKRRRAEALRRNADLLEQSSARRVQASEIERGTVPAERVRIVDAPPVRSIPTEVVELGSSTP